MLLLMETYSVDILHPKAFRLLQDLADLKLISLKSANSEPIEPQTTSLQELLLKGPTWSEEEHDSYLKIRESINKVGEQRLF